MEDDRNERFSILYESTIDDFISQPHIVIGCGAIGGPIVQILGQIGVKKLTLWDHDTVELVNLGPQGFDEEDVGLLKTWCRSHSFSHLSESSECIEMPYRFRKRHDHDTKAYWWMCVDSLSVRETILEVAMQYEPHRVIDMRMGGLNYEVYNVLGKPLDAFADTIQFARDNPVQEGCTTRSTPHTAMLASSIGINMALTEMPPYSVVGNMMDYHQDIRW